MIVHRAILKSGRTEVGYEFRKLDQPGRWSAHKDGADKPYIVNLIAKTCTCDAGRNGRLCKHRSTAAKLGEQMSAVKTPSKAAPVAEVATAAVAKADPEDRTLALAKILTRGDLTALSEEDRANYYLAVCTACELNPASRPFDFISVRGKTGPRTILYATKSATEQLRKRDGVSLTIVSQKEDNGLYIVTVEAALPDGRRDTDVGATSIGTGQHALTGEDRANAVMKAITKAKRRATLSICGLGMLDESEIESIPSAAPVESRPLPVAAPVTAAAPILSAPAAPFDRLKWLGEIEGMVEKLKLTQTQFEDGLKRAYGKPNVLGLVEEEIVDLHKRLSAKLPSEKAA